MQGLRQPPPPTSFVLVLRPVAARATAARSEFLSKCNRVRWLEAPTNSPEAIPPLGLTSRHPGRRCCRPPVDQPMCKDFQNGY